MITFGSTGPGTERHLCVCETAEKTQQGEREHTEGKGEARAECHPCIHLVWTFQVHAVPETLPKPTTELSARCPGSFPEEPSCRDSVLSKDATSNEPEQSSWPAFSPSCRPAGLCRLRGAWPRCERNSVTLTIAQCCFSLLASAALIWLLSGSLPPREVRGARGQWTHFQLVGVSGEAAALNPV